MCNNQQITVSHFGEHKRLNLESSKQNYLILVSFITGNSSLEPLIEGLYAQIHVNLRWRVFGTTLFLYEQ